MFASRKAVFECKESVPVLTQRWLALMEKNDSDPLRAKLRGVVTEKGFDLTMYLGVRGYPVLCHGVFEPTEHGTRIRVQFLPAIRLGRMIFLAGACVALVVVVFLGWTIWGIG